MMDEGDSQPMDLYAPAVTAPDRPLQVVSFPAGAVALTRAQAVALVAEQLAHGHAPAEIEDAVLKTPPLRPHAEGLIALCAAVAQGAEAREDADEASVVVALICASTPAPHRRKAALEPILRHELVRSTFGVPETPGPASYTTGVVTTALCLPFALQILRGSAGWATYGSPNTFQASLALLQDVLVRHWAGLGFTALMLATLALALAGRRPFHDLRRFLSWVLGAALIFPLRRLDAEATLLAFAEAGIPANLVPRPMRSALPPTRLWVLTRATQQSPDAARALADLEYTRALVAAESAASWNRMLVDFVQGGLVALICMILLGSLMPM